MKQRPAEERVGVFHFRRHDRVMHVRRVDIPMCFRVVGAGVVLLGAWMGPVAVGLGALAMLIGALIVVEMNAVAGAITHLQREGSVSPSRSTSYRVSETACVAVDGSRWPIDRVQRIEIGEQTSEQTRSYHVYIVLEHHVLCVFSGLYPSAKRAAELWYEAVCEVGGTAAWTGLPVHERGPLRGTIAVVLSFMALGALAITVACWALSVVEPMWMRGAVAIACASGMLAYEAAFEKCARRLSGGGVHEYVRERFGVS